MISVNNQGCPGNGWSVITSAPTNSQLAGVLAGFVFTGMIILFGRAGPKNTQSIGLFVATFVVLGFDSYLFSLVSGGTADSFCTRVWSEAMAASGMLAVGGAALVGGIAWLIVDHVDQGIAIGAIRGAVDLHRLARFMVYGVTIAVTLLLAVTTLDYLEVAFSGKEPDWLIWSVTATPVLVGVISGVLGVRRSQIAALWRSTTSTTAPSALSVSAFGLLVYAVICPLFAGALTNLPAEWWLPSRPLGFIASAIAIGLVLPSGLLVALILAAPPARAYMSSIQSVEPERAPRGGQVGEQLQVGTATKELPGSLISLPLGPGVDDGRDQRFLIAILTGVVLGTSIIALQALMNSPSRGVSLAAEWVLLAASLTMAILIYLASFFGSRVVLERLDATDSLLLIAVTLAEGATFSSIAARSGSQLALPWFVSFSATAAMATLTILKIKSKLRRQPNKILHQEAEQEYRRSQSRDAVMAALTAVYGVYYLVFHWPPTPGSMLAAGIVALAILIIANIQQAYGRRKLTRMIHRADPSGASSAQPAG